MTSSLATNSMHASDALPLPPPPPDERLTLVGLTKRYWTGLALDHVGFGVRKGEIFGFIGPNGAGKTTTIKAVVGLLQTYDGAVYLDGVLRRRGQDLDSARIGYLPQSAAFQSWRTVDQALTTFGRLSGLSVTAVQTRIREVLSDLGVLEVRFRRVTELSGGTLQKVGLAQAMLGGPSLLVLDEPMAPLDPASRFEFKGILRRLRAQGTTVLFSSHILSDVQDVADRFAVIVRGRIRHVGTFAELLARLPRRPEIEVEVVQDPVRPIRLASGAAPPDVEKVGERRYVAHLAADDDPDAMVGPLFDAFRAAGSVVRRIGPAVPDLESAYVEFLRVIPP